MSKQRKTEYKCKCEVVIKGREKEKKNDSLLNRIVTVPHCYLSVVCNTLEVIAHGISEIRIITHTVIDPIFTSSLMRSGMHVDVTGRTEVTVIVTAGSGAMANDAIVKVMRGVSDSVTLMINFREMMSAGGGDVDMRAGGMSRRCLGKRESTTGSDMRATSRGVAVAMTMAPFATVVT